MKWALKGFIIPPIAWILPKEAQDTKHFVEQAFRHCVPPTNLKEETKKRLKEQLAE